MIPPELILDRDSAIDAALAMLRVLGSTQRCLWARGSFGVNTSMQTAPEECDAEHPEAERAYT
ncbi:hypothetical protein JH26_00540 [Microvirga sp. BSC39]|nr:hypothetical protein JH26_00540 [Microvirga sp. BSC39]